MVSSFRVVSMTTLRRRLTEVLGDGTDLVRALEDEDLHLLAAVVQMVAEVPEASRDAVQSAIVDSLLADEAEAMSVAPARTVTLH